MAMMLRLKSNQPVVAKRVNLDSVETWDRTMYASISPGKGGDWRDSSDLQGQSGISISCAWDMKATKGRRGGSIAEPSQPAWYGIADGS
jgi:hypothetical protein